MSNDYTVRFGGKGFALWGSSLGINKRFCRENKQSSVYRTLITWSVNLAEPCEVTSARLWRPLCTSVSLTGCGHNRPGCWSMDKQLIAEQLMQLIYQLLSLNWKSNKSMVAALRGWIQTRRRQMALCSQWKCQRRMCYFQHFSMLAC